MPMTPLPTPPSPSDDVATFNARAAAHVAAQVLFVNEANALEAAVDADAAAASVARIAAELAETNAETARDAAQAARDAAAASAGAALWVSGASYALWQRAQSTVNGRLYERIVAGAGTTDPSSDGTNWRRVRMRADLLDARSLFLID